MESLVSGSPSHGKSSCLSALSTEVAALAGAAGFDRVVRDHHAGAALGGRQQVAGEFGGRLLIEDDDRKVGEQHPGEGEPLPLPSRQLGTVLADRGVKPGGQTVDPVQQSGPAQCVAQAVPS